MLFEKMKILTVISITLFIVCLYIDYMEYVPLDTRPTNLKLAKKLTRTIVRVSECKGMEHDKYIEGKYILSNCSKIDIKGASYTEGFYSIKIFFSKEEKNSFIKKLREHEEMYKEGEYYIISENSYYGESKSNEKRVKSLYAYTDFPGELIRTPLYKEKSASQ